MNTTGNKKTTTSMLEYVMYHCMAFLKHEEWLVRDRARADTMHEHEHPLQLCIVCNLMDSHVEAHGEM